MASDFMGLGSIETVRSAQCRQPPAPVRRGLTRGATATQWAKKKGRVERPFQRRGQRAVNRAAA
jgi:hypothetical protein